MTTYAPERLSRKPPERQDIDWSLLSPQGRVLFYVALCPHCSVEEISVALGLTERSVWSIIRSLRATDMVRYKRVGRRHRYSINLDAPLLAPALEGITLRSVLGDLVERADREQVANCVRIDDAEQEKR